MANPPFMSPKGGIRPHKRFAVPSKRSEVLFVDYIAEHLTVNGRAAVVVPEGVIFQTGTAYKALRKMLVEGYLVGVISLPAGIFNPYSGVKTSILWLDKTLAKKSDQIVFVKIQADGFDLGAQRRPVKQNDLPDALQAMTEYKAHLASGQAFEPDQYADVTLVEKARVAESGEYNLSGERYRETATNADLKWPLVPIGKLCLIERGASPRPIHDFITDSPDGVNWIKIGDAELGAKYITHTKEKVTPEGAAKSRRVKPGDFILSNSMSFGRPYIMATEGCIHDGWLLLRDQSERLDKDFLYHILGSKPVFEQFQQAATGGVVNNLNSEIVRKVRIPLPLLDVQAQIVAEIESYQKIIDGARQVLEHYAPRIEIDPAWPVVALGEVSNLTYGYTETAQDHGGARFVRITDIDENGELRNDGAKYVTLNNEVRQYVLHRNDLLVARTGATYGKTLLFESDIPAVYASYLIKIDLDQQRVLPKYYWIFTLSESYETQKARLVTGGGQPQFNSKAIQQIQIPLPDLATQERIVAQIEQEQALVRANRELVELFEGKIKARIATVWGEEG